MDSFQLMWTLLAFLGGLIIGSFLNVCIFRLPRDLSVWSPARSFCPGCETMIAWYDNIPLLSYALLGGKSRCCQQTIPLRYPFVELATGLAFALSVALFGPTPLGLKYVIFCALMIDLIVTDWEERILPDEFTLGGTVIGFVLAWYVPLPPDLADFLLTISGTQHDPRWTSLYEAALGAGLSSGVIFLLAFVLGRMRNKELMGFGDFKMLLLIGAFWGLRPVLSSVLLASLGGSLTGPIYAVIAKRQLIARITPKYGRRTAICAVIFRYPLPFGSFLGLAAMLVAFLWSTEA